MSKEDCESTVLAVLGELQTSVGDVRSELNLRTVGIGATLTRLSHEITEIRGEVREIRGDITEIRGDITELRRDMKKGFQGLGTYILAVDNDLKDLTKRVTKIEERLVSDNGKHRDDPDAGDLGT